MGKEYKKIHRLLNEVMMMRAEEGVNAEVLAEHYGVTERTIFRDIETLQQTGVPINFDHKTGGYKVGDEFFMQPVELTFEEGLAVCTLLSHIAESGQIPFIEPAVRAVMKIKSQMSDELREELSELDRHINIQLAASSEGEEVRDVYERVRDAISRRQTLMCTYESVGNGEGAAFEFEPYALFFGKRAWYVYGMHSGRGEVRCLKLQRFVTIQELKQTYEIPEGFDVEKYIGLAWRMIRGTERYQIVLYFDESFADTIADTRWHKTQELAYLDDGSLEFRCEVDGLDEIQWWVLGMGPYCKVVEPVELAERVKELAEGVVKQYVASEQDAS
ncbi:WYL domain-containing protein [Planctomycetota bacterium]|nr:WYL domain-containing protein [Planctomycetota bacterium]